MRSAGHNFNGIRTRSVRLRARVLQVYLEFKIM